MSTQTFDVDKEMIWYRQDNTRKPKRRASEYNKANRVGKPVNTDIPDTQLKTKPRRKS
jgi:hypothetical protein